MPRADIISDLQSRLDASSDPDTKQWFEDYLKGAIAYRGLKTPTVSRILQAWQAEHELTSQARMSAGRRLSESRYAEDKFAAFLLWAQELKAGTPPRSVLDEAERMLRGGHVFDWSTNDWLCMRVVGVCLERGSSPEAERVEAWSRAENLWQRRSSIVGFLNVVKDSAHHSRLKRLVKRLVKEDARFIQTGVGWVLAQLSRTYPELSAELVETHFDRLSREVIDRHTKYLPHHAAYKQRKRSP